jgi:mono/diheme cytochrome c family protein
MTAGLAGCQEFPQGERVYETYCVNCHMPDGSGLGTLIPALNSQRYRDLSIDQVVCKIKYGNNEVEDIYASFNPMPSFTNLSETDISNLINYINTQWAQKGKMTAPQEVSNALLDCGLNLEKTSK